MTFIVDSHYLWEHPLFLIIILQLCKNLTLLGQCMVPTKTLLQQGPLLYFTDPWGVKDPGWTIYPIPHNPGYRDYLNFRINFQTVWESVGSQPSFRAPGPCCCGLTRPQSHHCFWVISLTTTFIPQTFEHLQRPWKQTKDCLISSLYYNGEILLRN